MRPNSGPSLREPRRNTDRKSSARRIRSHGRSRSVRPPWPAVTSRPRSAGGPFDADASEPDGRPYSSSGPGSRACGDACGCWVGKFASCRVASAPEGGVVRREKGQCRKRSAGLSNRRPRAASVGLFRWGRCDSFAGRSSDKSGRFLLRQAARFPHMLKSLCKSSASRRFGSDRAPLHVCKCLIYNDFSLYSGARRGLGGVGF